MKQLIEIPAKFLKSGDLIFDFKHRDLQKVEYVFHEAKNGENCKNTMAPVHSIHVDYGEEAMSADNFKPETILMILIDTDKLEVVEPEYIGYR
ncbi:hypothetical protein [Halarcobacter sp.]|uniref:hypothetical protein n=1 Tax=Halarcobacter sp. TaxID=2321133 RepID=UPI0029F5B63C|nr:hypothetical protein [Halarcobacter sp.]